jgi:hypothetical protein
MKAECHAPLALHIVHEGLQEPKSGGCGAVLRPISGSSMTDQRPQNLVVAPDLDNPGYLWRVEWFDSDGAGYITIFAGQEAEARARDYHDAIRDGFLARTRNEENASIGPCLQL